MATLFATTVASAKPAGKDYKLSDGAGLLVGRQSQGARNVDAFCGCSWSGPRMMNRPRCMDMVSHPRAVARFVVECAEARIGAALVFVIAVDGGSMREPGLRMAASMIGIWREAHCSLGPTPNGCFYRKRPFNI